ncbi:MAG: electron transporter RnfE [Gammaproteobacteria bacterium RIFOXYA12_FULL_61_12]|nr:MAG: electron transporter RnfE [Gammaproteobacteria bacterium RIFOXYD12_FULL_61_37]OGT90026.1 MAG: electron transporter RnfE [Gammaproteobacteria bacterium RIFOXYA12_FULL_61_12]
MYGYEHVGMGLGMVLVWAIPIILVVLLIRFLIRAPDGKSGKGALEILEARYARGEIDRDEYLKRRADLEG